MQEKSFYVYVHKYASGPKQGQVFYVGKGKSYRLSDKKNRNNHWRNIVNKYGFDAQVVARFYREECALSFEVALIKHYGRSNLCNLTDGGDGMKNPSMETREKLSISAKSRSHELRLRMSALMTGRKMSEETKRKLSIAHRNITDETRKKMRMSRVGKHMCCETKDKIGAANRDTTMYVFHHKDGRVFTGTQYDLRMIYDLNSGSLSAMIKGRKHCVSVKGWYVVSSSNNNEKD